jgi:hypothetical protein
VFTNYSAKGLRTLIEWVVEKLNTLYQNGVGDNENNIDVSKMELSETDLH